MPLEIDLPKEEKSVTKINSSDDVTKQNKSDKPIYIGQQVFKK